MACMGSNKKRRKREAEDEIKRETRGMKKGGKVESKLMKKEGRGMAKATMQKVASKVVRGHEKRMHKTKSVVLLMGLLSVVKLVEGRCNDG
jgi:hypothetical protein